MWPLLLTSIVALTVVIERLYFTASERLRRRARGGRADLRSRRSGQARRRAERRSRLRRFRRTRADLRHSSIATCRSRNALLQASSRELQRFNRGLPILDTVITLAPLEGLFGTVTGMIHAFGLLGASELGAPTAITGGIAEALIATAFGLLIAMVALIAVQLPECPARTGAPGDRERRSASGDAAAEVGEEPRRKTGIMTIIPSPRSNRRPRIEIIPLIDIIFFLLATFVMVSLSMIQNRGIPVQLPAATTGLPQAREDSASISISERGEVYFEKQLVDATQLDAALRQSRRRESRREGLHQRRHPRRVRQGHRGARRGPSCRHRQRRHRDSPEDTVRRSIVASGVVAIVLHGFVLFGLQLDRAAVPLPPAPGPIVVGLVASAPQPAAVPAPPEPKPDTPSVPEPPKTPGKIAREETRSLQRSSPTPKQKASEAAAPEPVAEQPPSTSASGGGSAAPSAAKRPHRVQDGLVSSVPRYRNTPPPRYPPSARREHQEGVVLLSVDVGVDGRPTAVVVKRSSGVRILDQAAITAVRRWTFEPARTAGLPVESTVEVPVRFSLAD